MAEAQCIDEVLERVLERGRAALASDAEIERWEAQQDERDRRDRLDVSKIGERLDERGAHAVITGNLADTRALQLVRAWVPSSRPMLVLLSSTPGLGKTVAAAWALSRMAGRYVHAQELCEMRNTFRARAQYERYLSTELLVVDELGLEDDEGRARQVLEDVIDKRQRVPRRTLLLGNLDREGLIKRYDARSLSRLGIASDESGIAIIRSLRGPDMRGAR